MIRESSAHAIVLAALASSGCSLVLDFSDSQIPGDASPDMPYTEEECMYKEPNDGVASAALVVPGDTGPAAICQADPEDSDFYRFTVPDGTTMVQIDLMFTNFGGGDLDLKLLDANGSMITQSRGVGDTETIICPATSPACATLTPGDYIFQVFPALGSVNSYTFALTLTP